MKPSRLPRRAERGFSLLELMIAVALMIVALALANELLIESQRRLAIGARAQLEPDDSLALRLLRDDLRAAAPIAGWSGPLDCRRPELTARWELTGETLQRRTFDLDDVDRGARAMLDRVVAFRWRSIASPSSSGGGVEVEIVRRRLEPGIALRAGSARWHQIAETLETTRVVAASRVAAP